MSRFKHFPMYFYFVTMAAVHAYYTAENCTAESSNFSVEQTTSNENITADVNIAGLVSINATTMSTTTLSTTTLTEKQFPNLPDDINKLPCSVLSEYGAWNLLFKYTQAELKVMICRCAGLCADITLSPSIKKEVDRRQNDPLSEKNKNTFIAVMAVYCTLFLVGISGNCVTITGLLCWVKTTTPTFAFIVSLSFSDLLLIIVCMPLKITEYFNLADIFTTETCKLSYYVRDFTLVCSVLTLTVISFERYYAICHPLKVQYRCTWKRARIMIIGLWILSACLATPTIFATEFYIPVGSIRHECLQQAREDTHLQLYFIYYLGVLFFFPVLVMIYTYGCSCRGLWRSAEMSQSLQGNNRVDGGRNQRKDTTGKLETGDKKSRKKGNVYYSGFVMFDWIVMKVLILILICFVFCWGPPLIVQLLTVLGVIRAHAEKVRLGFETLTYLSSALNPYFFMAMSSHFRESAIRCMKRLRHGRRDLQYLSTYRDYSTSLTRMATVTYPHAYTSETAYTSSESIGV